MKNKAGIILITILIILMASSLVTADGGYSGWQQNHEQSYPVPHYYPIGQGQNNNNKPDFNTTEPQHHHEHHQPQQQPENQNQQPQFPFYPIQLQNQNNSYQPYQPYNGYDPNTYYYNNNPIYDPWSDMYYYRIYDDQEGWPYQPVYPYYRQGNNAQVSKQWNYDGSLSLTWTIYNSTNEDWYRSNVDIKCISGCHLLTNPYQTLWDIPYTVYRGGTLTYTVNIWQPMYGESMTFAMVAGSKTLYTFTVNP